MRMTPLEREYRATATRIGCALLVFSALSLIRGAVLAFLPLFCGELSALGAEITEQLVGGLLYALVFVLPLPFFRMISRGYVCRTPRYALELSGDGLRCAIFGVAVTMTLAFVNAQLVNVFDYGAFSKEYLWQTEASENYQLLLLFLTMAVIPAFVEELLFRGLILENLLPYGKTVAILGSALLFGMMHRNAEQLLYATGAGIVFGWIYVRTRSIWPCVLAHFINNFYSVAQIALVERLSALRAQLLLYVLEGMLLVLGILCAVRLFREENVRQESALSSTEQEIQQLPLCRRARLFFSVPMTLFLLWCVANMLTLIIMAML
jgi:membrane protease YdiL (CAAX protease family)